MRTFTSKLLVSMLGLAIAGSGVLTFAAWSDFHESADTSYSGIPNPVVTPAVASSEPSNISTVVPAVKDPEPSSPASAPSVPGPIPAVSSEADLSAPVRVEIPQIGVNARVFPVGLTSAGNMDMVGNSVDVAWYKYGPFPGAPGNAVLGGHELTSYDPEGVFFDLKDLRPGDLVKVTEATGRTVTFRVRETRMYRYDDIAPEIFAQSAASHLNLITCAGEWLSSVKLYSQRLVVFTDLVA